MHVLAHHLPEVMRMHGNPTYFCQQGLEKLNDFVTKWYFRSTNFGKEALKKVMQKQNRLMLLESRCKRSPKWQVKCSSCQKQDGHQSARSLPCNEAIHEILFAAKNALVRSGNSREKNAI